jgi:hypothetical protein
MTVWTFPTSARACTANSAGNWARSVRHRDAEDDRLVLVPRQAKRFAHVRGNAVRGAGGGERRLIERLIVAFGMDRRLADEHHGGRRPRTRRRAPS